MCGFIWKLQCEWNFDRDDLTKNSSHKCSTGESSIKGRGRHCRRRNWCNVPIFVDFGFNSMCACSRSDLVAATLLDRGRMIHTALELTSNFYMNDEPTCNISRNSAMAQVFKASKFIIWDEWTMAQKRSLEVLNWTIKYFRNNAQTLGGTMILLAVDFRQNAPVIPLWTLAWNYRISGDM